ncbi:hypothetical protein T07_9752 [Trichinella nelsoni]|uniref:Uncharacterized protein n=1 Tax=Trichinella nelsoni TaxID=6336 RepID=A0A0V0RCC9_9BILA|nr:hypothetical protein T07_9752 [Trichinella nelsoni]
MPNEKYKLVTKLNSKRFLYKNGIFLSCIIDNTIRLVIFDLLS